MGVGGGMGGWIMREYRQLSQLDWAWAELGNKVERITVEAKV